MGIWPFGSNNVSIKNSGLLNGMTDWHSHILPGVDDGFKTLEDSLKALDILEKEGVKKLWLTPHIMEDCPNETADLIRAFEDLKLAYSGSISLNLAAENMIDALFEERLENKDFLPIGDDGRFLLVETSYFSPPMNMIQTLEQVQSAGYHPLLAHPERYRYMDEKDYQRLKEMGVFFQGNYFSIIGAYGNTARKKLEWMLKMNMIDVIGSDLHRSSVLDHALHEIPKKKKSLETLKAISKSNLQA